MMMAAVKVNEWQNRVANVGEDIQQLNTGAL